MFKKTKLKPLLLFFFSIPFICLAQPEGFHEVKGLPTKEVYDLLVDKKGFLWIAHSLGVSRYDGVSFTHFSNPEENSLGMTDLIEDSVGRIWCHNFSSQIFYIENEKMNLLSEYKSRDETFFPRMALLDNTLYVTSMNGLFTFNTKLKKANYYFTDFDTTRSNLGHRQSIFYLSILKDRILLNGFGRWFQFDPKENKLKRLFTSSEDTRNIIKRDIHLQPKGNKDTAYGALNEKLLFLKILVHKDSVFIIDNIKSKEIINNITWSGDNYWLHTKDHSSALGGTDSIVNANITDLVFDKEGNTWCSSFKYGLIVRNKNYWKESKTILLNKDDFIRQASEGGSTYVYGTQGGEILIHDSSTKKNIFKLKLPLYSGAVEFIKYIGNYRFLISGSLYSYILEIKNRKLNLLTKNVIIKDAVEGNGGFYLATNQGIQFLEIKENSQYNLTLIYRHRCFQIAFDPKHNILLVAFADGLYQIVDNRVIPILYKTKHLNASSVYFSNGKFYFTSLDGSLFIKKDSSIELLQPKKTRISNVLSIKGFNNHLWFIRPYSIRVFDTKLDNPIEELLIPPLSDKKIYDILEIDSTLTAFTSEGQYQIPLRKATLTNLKSYLIKVTINNKDSVSNKLTLPFNKGNIDFHLSAPYFTNPEQVYFKYRLIGSNNENWDTTENYQRVISYASLQPNRYKFEAIAINPLTNTIVEPLIFEFEIWPPWYNTIWFKVLLSILISLILYGIYIYQKAQKARIEKLRSQITADLHDDIGATLSSINIYAEIAKNEPTTFIINTIQNNTQYAISSLDEMVWNLTDKKETIEHLISRMEHFASPLFKAKNIELDLSKGIKDEQVFPKADTTRHIYFIFKELINNVVKHSDANYCKIDIEQRSNQFYFQVIDNGNGFDINKAEIKGNGIVNIKRRTQEVGGELLINSKLNSGTIAEFIIPINDA